MQSFTSPSKPERPSFLLIGPPGSGKSVLATAFPKVYIVEADNNLDGVMRFYRDNKLSTDHIVGYDVPHLKEDGTLVPEGDRWTVMGDRINKALKEHPEIQTICIDSLTALLQYMMDDVRRQQALYDNSKEGKAPQLGEVIPPGDFFHGNLKTRAIDGTLRIQDWGVFRDAARKFFLRLKSTRRNIVVTAHVENDKDEVNQSYRKFIKCPGSFRDEVAGHFSDAFFMDTDSEVVGQDRIYFKTITTVPITGLKDLGLKRSVKLSNMEKLKPTDIFTFIKKALTLNEQPTNPTNPTK